MVNDVRPLRTAIIGLLGFAAVEEQLLLTSVRRAPAEPGRPGCWAAAPLVAHNTGFKRQQVQRLDAIRRGQAPPESAEIDHTSDDVDRGYRQPSADQAARDSWEQQVETVLFPPNQTKAYNAFAAAISGYPPAAAPSAAVLAAHRRAVTQWWTGNDPAGRKTAGISVPTLIADGSADWVDPVANDRTLARLIPDARLVLYPDAAHAFLFQDGTRFAAVVDSFLKA